MKNKNKTILEANKGSMTKKIGRYAVIVALYIAIVTTLAFIISTLTLIVNADSSGGGVPWFNPYTYSSMTIYTDNGSYCVGSNDYFTASGTSQSGVSFDDYYSIYFEDVYFYISSTDNTINYSFVLPNDNITFYDLFTQYGQLNGSNYVYYSVESDDVYLSCPKSTIDNQISGLVYIYLSEERFQLGRILFTSINENDVFSISIASSSNYVSDTNLSGVFLLNNRAVADSPISIKRLNSAIYNSNGGYYSVFSEITSPNIIGFDFNFTKDIAVTYSQLSNNEFYYNYSMTQDFSITKVYTLLFYDVDGNLQSQEITSIISYDAGDTGTLLPTLSEIVINIGEDTMSSQDIYLIQDLYVSTNSSIVVGTDYVHIFEWLAYNSTDTKLISNNYVNNFYRTTKIDIGEILLNSVNSFLGFELIPGFSLLSLLALIIGIPLLIYILKLFLGG